MFEDSDNNEDIIFLNVKSVKNPSEFMACLGTIRDFSKFDSFLQKLNDWCGNNSLNDASNSSDLEVNQSVLVKYQINKNDDLLWKRAKIIEIIRTDEKINVLLVDHAIFQKFDFSEIKTNIPSFFDDFGAQAKRCKLSNAIPKQSLNWSSEAIEYFNKIINQDGLAAYFVNKKTINEDIFDQEYEIEVFYVKDKKKILDVMVSEGHATVESFSDYRIKPIDIDDDSIKLSSDDDDDNDNDVIPIDSNNNMSKNITNKSSTPNSKDSDIECISDDNQNGFRITKNTSISNKATSNRQTLLNKKKDSNHFVNSANNINIRSLITHDYICSDDTIQTGYKPNVHINAASISQQIKAANLRLLNSTKNLNSNSLLNNSLNSIRNTKYYEEKVYQIISESNGLYDNQEKQYNAITKIYIENPSSNVTLILKCILREIKNNNIGIIDAFDLMNKLKFCNEKYFKTAFIEVFNENCPSEADQDMIMIGDSKRQNLALYLANVYKIACNRNKYKYLESISNFCNDTLKEWINIKNLHETNAFKIAKLKCVHDFLSECLEDFKLNHFETFDYILEKSLECVSDFTVYRDIISASNQIVALYARAFRNSRPLNENERNSSVTDHTSQSSVDNHIRFHKRKSGKRKSTSPSFLDRYTMEDND